MKKVLFILAFLAIGMIATAQTQTIYNQLKLATVNDGTVSDSLVLVQGTDKIIRKIPLSSISGSTEIPSLQEVTNNGNVTSHPIHAKEFRIDSNADSLMVLNNRFLTFGDVGKDYSGNWTKYFSVFNPNVSDGMEFYLQGTNYGDYQRFNVSPSLISMAWGQGNSTDYIASSFQLRDTGTVLRAVSTVSGEQSTNTLNVTSDYVELFTSKPAEAKSMKLRLNEYQPNGSFYSISLPASSGELAVRNLVVPIAGTDTGNPLTGRIEFASDPSDTFASSMDGLVIGAGNDYNLDENATIKASTQYSYNANNALARLSAENVGSGLIAQVSVVVDGDGGEDYVELSTSGKSVGLVGIYDYSAYATDKAYVQKSYVNNATVNSTTYYNAGGNISLINDTTGDLSVTGMGVKLAELGYSGLTLYKNSGSVNANITNRLLTSSRSYYLPNANGTLAAIGTNAPASAKAAGSVGEIRVTATYIYVCTATNTWVRAPLATW